MAWLSDTIIEFVSEENNPLGLLVLATSAMVEYIFPPFPGDTITLFGAILITAYRWSFIAVFGAVMFGSIAGSMIDFYLGQRLRLHAERNPKEETRRRAAINKLVTKFEQHGALYLVINRFLPGIRALFFVAAGMANMRPAAVLFYSAISAALWNLGLILLGSVVGMNFESLTTFMRQYSIVMWLLIGAVVVFFVAKAVWTRRRQRETHDDEAPREPPG